MTRENPSAVNSLYHRASFLKSAAAISQLPPADDAHEVAFAGRSNAGKSSALNVICARKSLARTSKTPGRTQLINLFELDARRRLVDLPGYGFARVSLPIRAQWQGLLTQYIEERDCLRGIILLMDIRHPLKELDVQMIEWCRSFDLPLHVLLTKSDKLSRGAGKQALLGVQRALKGDPEISVQRFSALARTGIEEAHAVLDRWLRVSRDNNR